LREVYDCFMTFIADYLGCMKPLLSMSPSINPSISRNADEIEISFYVDHQGYEVPDDEGDDIHTTDETFVHVYRDNRISVHTVCAEDEWGESSSETYKYSSDTKFEDFTNDELTRMAYQVYSI
jgi:hypothetical protein